MKWSCICAGDAVVFRGSVMCLCCVLVFVVVCCRWCRRCVVGCISVVVDPLLLHGAQKRDVTSVTVPKKDL